MFVQCDDLTIKRHVIERFDCLTNDGKALREVILIPRVQPDPLLILLCNPPELIPLQLEQPAFVVERDRF